MYTPENSYNYQPPQPYYPQPDPEVIKFQAEKRKMKNDMNTIGIMILIASVVFFVFSLILSFIYYAFVGTKTLQANVDSIPMDILSGFANIAAIGLCGLVFIILGKNKLSDVLIFEKVSAKKLLAVVAIGFTVCMVSNMMISLYLTTTYNAGLDLNIDIDTPLCNSVLEIIVYFLSTSIVPAFSEEILFRGAILGSLRKYGDTFAIFVSSLLFALFHANFVQIPFAFVVGLVISWTVVYTGSMLPAIIIHAANNGFSVLSDIIYSNIDSLILSETMADALSVLFVSVMAIICLVAVVKLSRKDKNFLKPAQYDGILDRKTRVNALVTSPAIITSTALLLIESVITHTAV